MRIGVDASRLAFLPAVKSHENCAVELCMCNMSVHV